MKYLTQGLCIWTHVCQDDQHMVLTLISQKLRCRQGQTWSDDTLNAAEQVNTQRINVNE